MRRLGDTLVTNFPDRTTWQTSADSGPRRHPIAHHRRPDGKLGSDCWTTSLDSTQEIARNDIPPWVLAGSIRDDGLPEVITDAVEAHTFQTIAIC